MKLLALVVVFLVADIYETLAAPASTYDQQQTGDLNVHVELKDIEIVAVIGDSDIFGNLGEYDYAYDYSDFTLKPITPHATTSASSSTTLSSTSVKPWHTWPTITSTQSTSTVSEIAEENLPATSSVAAAEQGTVNSLQSVESEVNGKPEKNSSSSAVAAPSSSSAEAQSTAITNESDKTPASALPEPQATPTTETSSVDEKTGPADDPSKDEDPVAAAIPAPEKLQASSSSPSSEEYPSSSAAPVKSEASTNQTQSLRRCNPGYARDQKGRCSRVHNRRRIPASLLPFGIRLTPKIFRQRDHQSDNSEN